MDELNDIFHSLSRTKKVEFVSANFQYASAHAVAGYVKGYLFDVLENVEDDDYIADYLLQKGYEVIRKF